MSALLASLLPGLLSTVGTIVLALFAWLGTKLTNSINSKNKAEAAAAKVGQIALAIAGNIWSTLSAEIQTRLADGELSKEDRAALAEIVLAEIKKLDIGDTVEEIAKALGLPLTSVIGTIVEWLVNRYTSAHDAANTSVSAKAYPLPAARSTDPSPAPRPTSQYRVGMGG